MESGSHPDAVRFEPQVFRNHTGHRFDASVPYEPDERGIDRVPAHTNRAAFEHAFGFDPAQAVCATSWGAYQVMGWRLLALYPGLRPVDAVACFDADPRSVGEHLFVAVIADPRNRPLQRAINAHDWATVARWYNGPGNVARYSAKLSAAYAAQG